MFKPQLEYYVSSINSVHWPKSTRPVRDLGGVHHWKSKSAFKTVTQSENRLKNCICWECMLSLLVIHFWRNKLWKIRIDILNGLSQQWHYLSLNHFRPASNISHWHIYTYPWTYSQFQKNAYHRSLYSQHFVNDTHSNISTFSST